jgi:Ca2+-binding RTX toxin-like protein
MKKLIQSIAAVATVAALFPAVSAAAITTETFTYSVSPANNTLVSKSFISNWDSLDTSNRTRTRVVLQGVYPSDVVVETTAGDEFFTLHIKGQKDAFRTLFWRNEGYSERGATEIVFANGTKWTSVANFGITVRNGTSRADSITGTNVFQQINGLGANDVLRGGTRDDILNGGEGNDDLFGGSANDVYQFSGNFGYDLVTDTAGSNDIIRFANLSVYDVRFTRVNNDLILQVEANTANKVKVVGYYTSAGLIEQIKFAGVPGRADLPPTVLNSSDVAARVACQTPGCFSPPSP